MSELAKLQRRDLSARRHMFLLFLFISLGYTLLTDPCLAPPFTSFTDD